MLTQRIKNEPLVVIGVIAAAIFAGVQAAAGKELITPDLAASLERALNPDGGWLWPIVLAIIGRFFVFGPQTAATLRDSLPPGYTSPEP